MKRRSAWVALAAAVIALGVVAWLAVDDSVDQARTAVVAAKTHEAAASEAARRANAPIPFSPSRTEAGVPHKTAAAQPLPPNAPIKSILAGLLEQANGQPPNAEAATRAYEILTQCRRLAQDPPKEPNPDGPDCTGVTESDWAGAARLLKMAAELGNERAQLTVAQRLVGLGREPAELASNQEELLAMNDKARSYLSSLAERGNVDGMWFLGESLRLGEFSEPDLTMAYAYKYAVARAGGYPYTIDSELAALESQLSPQQQSRAREFADRLIARCCSRR